MYTTRDEDFSIKLVNIKIFTTSDCSNIIERVSTQCHKSKYFYRKVMKECNDTRTTKQIFTDH